MSVQAAKIVGLGGSLASASRSLTALRVAAEAAEEEGADVSIFERALGHEVAAICLKRRSAPWSSP